MQVCSVEGLSDENRYSRLFSGDDIRLKRHQLRKFTERKVKGTSGGAKLILDVAEEKTIIVTIVVALVILGALLVNLVFFTPAQKEPFASIYLLDSEKQLENFPKTVVLGENNTVSLWVGVENQNDTTMDYSVLVKIDDGKAPVDPSPAEPTESFERTLLNGELWEFPVTISIDQLGSHRIIFELWSFNVTKNDFDYTGNWVCLSVEAIQA
jgi:uncharacterized membrane protein